MATHRIPLDNEVFHGIGLINRGDYFHAHEVLEKAWIRERRPVRQLYQGLIQVSVLLYHLEKKNRKGVLKLLKMAAKNLEPFEDTNEPFNVCSLLADLNRVQQQIEFSVNENKDLPAIQISIQVKI